MLAIWLEMRLKSKRICVCSGKKKERGLSIDGESVEELICCVFDV